MFFIFLLLIVIFPAFQAQRDFNNFIKKRRHKMILHIPHSSTTLPDNFQVSEGVSLEKEFQRMTDWFTGELFDSPDAKKVVFPHSRLYCDVERFRDDEKEEMAKKGMGVCYSRSSFGDRLREVNEKEKSIIKSTHYDEHHRRFTDLVAAELKENGSALIIDCHSFSDEVLPHEESDVRPDICIGTNDFHTPVALLSKVHHYFEDQGYTVAVNQPFSGTIVPLEYYGKEQRVKSIMIEINRRLYLDENFQKNENFNKTRVLINNVLKDILET